MCFPSPKTPQGTHSLILPTYNYMEYINVFKNYKSHKSH